MPKKAMLKNSPLTAVILCTILLFNVLSCNNSKEKEQEESSYTEQYAASFSKSLDLSTIPKTELIPEADEALSDWSEFMSVKSEIEKLEDYSLQNLISNAENLTEAIENLQDSIPEQFNKTPIKSRMNVLATKSKILQQYTKQEGLDTTEIQQNGADIYNAFGNLKIQMNEVFLEHLPEFDTDLDRKQDSIQNAAKENS